MNEGFSAFKALAWGIAALFAVAIMVPDTGSHFDRLRISKDVGKRGKSDGSVKVAQTTLPTTNVLYPEETFIPSNFDVDSELVPAWGTGAIPPSGKGVGAFRFLCGPGHLAYDDPIVYPGQPGRSHLHQFYGNTGANAYSTFESLRTTGQSTCMSPVNRSAYWMPAMLNGRGQVVRPDYVGIYYKRLPKSFSRCDPLKDPEAIGICIALPNGLKYVFGHDMARPEAGGGFYFNCDGPGAVQGHYPDIVTAAQYCPNGSKLGAVIHAPQCWDGKNLDSPDHRSHVAYTWRAPDGSSGVHPKCPSTHPFAIPEFTLQAWYTVDDTLDRSGTWDPERTVTWHLSSDAMPGRPKSKPGTTFHADWWGAWDNRVMAMWTDNCIDKYLECSGGDLGNGLQMKMFSGWSWTANPRLVPVP